MTTPAGKTAKEASRRERIRKLGRVLVINMGGTSTKLAIYSGGEAVHQEQLAFTPPPRAKRLQDELRPRLEQVQRFLDSVGVKLAKFAAIIARGGLMAPMEAGVYRINQRMLDDLASGKYGEHASNLCAQVAYELAREHDLPAFIADPIVVDEFPPEARVSGFPGINRVSRQHTLNVRAVARRVAGDLGMPFSRLNAVVAHLGTGFSIVTVRRGRLVDNADAMLGEGPFSIERAGTLPLRGVLDLAYSHPDRKQVERLLVKQSGLAGYLGTNRFPEIERRLEANDEKAQLIYNAMVHQIAKNVAAYPAPLKRAPDAIIITGGLAHSKRLIRDLKAYLRWLAPIVVVPGENEMQALADAAYMALLGEERIREYQG